MLKSAEQKKKGDMPEDVASPVSVEDSAIVKEQLDNVRKAMRTFGYISSKIDKGEEIIHNVNH